MRMRINSLRGCDLLLMKGCHPHLPLSVSKAWPRAIAEAWVCTEIQLHPEQPDTMPRGPSPHHPSPPPPRPPGIPFAHFLASV